MPVARPPHSPRIPPRQQEDAPTAAAANSTTMKGADFGKAIGIDRPANVKDKIRKWQAELDAGAGAEDAVTPAPGGDGKPVPSSPRLLATPKATLLDDKPSLKPAQTPTTPVDASPERPRSAKKPPAHNQLDDEVHTATAPKKRVVSDSHWRNKSPPKDAAARASPKPLPTA